MNPDGLHTVWHKDRMARTNNNGVDLNRNYPIGFKDSCGGSSVHGDETYRGEHPFSEPETKTMKAFQESMQFAKLVDFHSFARQVRINYGPCAPLPKGMHDLFMAHASTFASKMPGYKQSQSCCMGGDIHYGYNRHGSLAFLVETGQRFQPDAKEMRDELKIVYPGILSFLAIPLALQGIVTDKETGKPVRAVIKAPGLKLNLDERSVSSESNGRYHLWAPPGKLELVVTAQGYTEHKQQVQISSEGSHQAIALSRAR